MTMWALDSAFSGPDGADGSQYWIIAAEEAKALVRKTLDEV